jgi:hypothetical protein
MIGTFLYGSLIVPKGDSDTDTYYLPVQQYVSTFEEEDTGVDVRFANPILNINARNIEVSVNKSANFSDTG